MKILFLGEIGPGQTSQMRMRAFERLGHEVRGVNTIEPWQQVSWLQRQMQRRLGRGSVVQEINRKVLDAARAFHPELVWAEKQEYLSVETIEVLRALSQHQHFAALLEDRSDLGGDGLGPGQVIGEMPEHVLNACCGRQVDAGRP